MLLAKRSRSAKDSLRRQPTVHELRPYKQFYIETKPIELRGASFAGRRIFWAVLMTLSLASGVIGWRLYDTAQQVAVEPRLVHFELRAIDPAGHPVAGAQVELGGKKLGVTDSFGEWRRFLRAKPGTSVTLAIEKKAADGLLAATKTLQLPLTVKSGGDLQVSASLQLAPPEQAARKARKGSAVKR